MIMDLNSDWKVLQDVHEIGEASNIFRMTFDSTKIGGGSCLMPAWTPIERLEHLQLTFAENPYYGRGLRQFNDAPWWYRKEFTVEETTGYAELTFHGVDYFADIYFNEQLLGSHEGYGTPFSFEVGDLIKAGEPNLLVVKVYAPWENDVLPEYDYDRVLGVKRHQMKGTYEHSDTFVPRDINPIGIWNDVTLHIHNGVRLEENTDIDAVPADDFQTAQVRVRYRYDNIARFPDAEFHVAIREYGSPHIVTEWSGLVGLQPYSGMLERTFTVHNPKLWTIREWGEPHRYTVTMTMTRNGQVLLTDTQVFGIRKIEVVRTPEETTFYLNGERVYVRGATYFPDIYISAMTKERYVRDLNAVERAGMNALRVHVHSEKDEFYDMCDERGILLIQDSDFNWVHPVDMEWSARAVAMYREMIRRLKNHPSIFCWVCLNEPRMDSYLEVCPGPQMVEASKEMDPYRPYIKSSWAENDLESGDSHNYEGSLFGHDRHYTDIYDTSEKFNTEFGMDAPPSLYSLRQQPIMYRILHGILDRIDSIQYYQYRYIKYFIEHYRMQKFMPCAGHFLFLFSDAAPCSFFGAYDWWGLPKYAVRALEESNQPIGFFMECKKSEPVALWAVNDFRKNQGTVQAFWRVTDDTGAVILEENRQIVLEANSLVKVADLEFLPDPHREYTVQLELRNVQGERITKNIYEKAFNPPEHPEGHPEYVHHRIGMRTFGPWKEDPV